MRAGTQTLIQALQALPLVDDQEIDDELTNHDPSLAESDSDDDGKQRGSLFYYRILRDLLCPPATTLASSIHTIYRPVARSRRQESLQTLSAVDETLGGPADLSSGQEQLQRSMMSDEDTDADDFELPKFIARSRRASKKDRPIGLSPVLEHSFPKFDRRHHGERSGSMSTVKTVKLNRRARLAEKLAEVFDIGGINEVIAGG
jgi:sterol 3beta-glucosyltransferase